MSDLYDLANRGLHYDSHRRVFLHFPSEMNIVISIDGKRIITEICFCFVVSFSLS